MPAPLSRRPVRFRMDLPAPPETSRIFVLGGSAARGTPDPVYGLPRMLQAMLDEAAPDHGWEVYNLGLTAINSHVVLDQVREALRYDPAAIVVYVGNNEVVGPFGAGTVFGARAPPRWRVRTTIALRRTRTGQWLDRGLQRLGRGDLPREWAGMSMFLEARVAGDDPALARVRESFRRNLEAMGRAARRKGVPLVLTTVPVNLRDCPPFASADVPPGDWPLRMREAVAMIHEGRAEDARRILEALVAEQVHHAEAHYHLGRAHEALGQRTQASDAFRRARDLDPLRFRADEEINRIIREVAADWSDRGVRLVDAESALGEHPLAVHGLPGDGLFLEHVHLTFTGNHAVAAAIFPELWSALRTTAAPPVPDEAACARRMAYGPLAELGIWRKAEGMFLRPPFTAQWDHRARRLAIWNRIQRLRQEAAALRWDDILTGLEQASGAPPHRIEMRVQHGRALAQTGRAEEALPDARRLGDLLPGEDSLLLHTFQILHELGREDEADQVLARLRDTSPDPAEALASVAAYLRGRGDPESALRVARQAVAQNPDASDARNELAFALAQTGQPGEALPHFQFVARRRPDHARSQQNLGACLILNLRYEDAELPLRKALVLDPYFPNALRQMAQVCEHTGRTEEARALRAQAARLEAPPPSPREASGRELDGGGTLLLMP